jgi:ribosomal protein S12 methylthiotransferase accessory factor
MSVSDVAAYLSDPSRGLPAGVRVDVDHLGLRDRLSEQPSGRCTDGRPGGPTMVVRLYGRTAIVGPVCAAGAGGRRARPCARCRERRGQELRPVDEHRALLRADGRARGAGAMPALPMTLHRIAQVGRHLLAQHADNAAENMAAPVYEVGLDNGVVRRHTLLADSLCPDCAAPEPDTPDRAVLALAPRPKPAPGRYRLRSVADYPLEGYVGPVCGTVSAVALRAYQFTATAPVIGAFTARSKYGVHNMAWSGHAGTYADSERYGILEGIERYAGQRARARTVDVHDSLANLTDRGRAALDPSPCGTYRPGYYTGRTHAQPFTPDLPTYWVWGYSLRDRRALLVPEQLVYYLDRRTDHATFVHECSNGCASGSCPEEAALYGLLELVERDAFLLAWYSGRTLPEIDIRSVRDPQVRFMRERVGLLGYDVRLLDLRADLPVPVVLAAAVRREPGPGALCLAAGSGFAPEDAVRAALCETASYVAGLPERVTERIDELRAMAADYERVTELEHHPLLYGVPEMARYAAFLHGSAPPRDLDDLYAGWLAERPDTGDLTDDLRFLVDRVVRLGGDVIAVDQTAPEQVRSGVHTMAVIAPGLVPIDFGWARQRVLHHPRFTGWLRRTGAAPHPHPHPFP